MSNPSMYGWGCNPFLNTVPVPSSVYYQMMETNQRVYELQVENNRLRAANQNLQRQLNQHELDLEYTRKQHMRVLEQSRREKHHHDHHDHETSSVEHS
jgi:regulator of replication initiation timing